MSRKTNLLGFDHDSLQNFNGRERNIAINAALNRGNVEVKTMNQYVSGLALPKEKVSVWTPWGVQKVTDLDRALATTKKPHKLSRIKRAAAEREAVLRDEG